jgi:DNA-binding NarL/FixJ family response regulator
MGCPTPATGSAQRQSAGQSRLVTLSILIVDDSGPFLEVARRLLERDGFEVVGTASTSAEAVVQVEAVHPQVALVDIHLAGESGFEVARQLVRGDQVAGTSVILMSTHSETELADLIAESPAAAFVAKERLSGEAIRVALGGGTR